MTAQRSRKFVFTLNNYTDEHQRLLREAGFRYIIWGREVAPTTETRHLQGYVYLRSASTMSTMRRKICGAHIEIARGSNKQCIDYCKKDGDFEEHGEPPRDREDGGDDEKKRWAEAWEKAKEGDIESVPADIRIRCYSTLKRIRRDFEPSIKPMDHTAGVWIHGEAGTGKTRAVFETYPECYPKAINKWWCGYQGEEVVLIDDIDKSHATWIANFLKIWGDRYPFIGEEKGGSGKIRPKKVIITSQYSIEDIWGDAETRAALVRRYVVIHKEKDQNIII